MLPPLPDGAPLQSTDWIKMFPPEGGAHLFHITTLGNPCFLLFLFSWDRKTMEQEIKHRRGIRRSVCSSSAPDIFALWLLAVLDWLPQPTCMHPYEHLLTAAETGPAESLKLFLVAV